MLNYKLLSVMIFVTLHLVRMQSIAMSVSGCHHTTDFTKFSVRYILPVAVAWSSSDSNAICYVLVDDVMFACNGANGPESKTLLMFNPVCYVAAPGVKSAVSNCIFLVMQCMTGGLLKL